MTASAAARFLQQASWGPNAASIAEVQALGMSGWIDSQIALPQAQWSVIPDEGVNGANTTIRPVQDAFYLNAVSGKDQLRQRVAFALENIWVVSTVKLTPAALPPYLRMLQADAFSTYDKIMYDVTLSPAMGHYLDMVNNNKPTPGRGANENYARELMQLFTIGLSQLDAWGRPVKDAKGNLIPTYTQDTIEGFANVFTGWTYAPIGTAVSKFPNPENWHAPMVAFDKNHDMTVKVLLNGVTLPAAQTAAKDLQDALGIVFHHSNVGPFICRQLIQHLVSSSPSDNYVKRVADVFNSAPRGDMKAVVKAILLDSEARQGDDGGMPAATKLREPVLWINAFLRGVDAQVTASNSVTTYISGLGQNIYGPASVFNFFPPDYEISIGPSTTYNAPEFGLLSEASALAGSNVMNSFAFGKPTGVTIDLSPYIKMLGAKPTAGAVSTMVEALNQALMGGRMTVQMKDTITTAVAKAATPTLMVETAIYLIGSSWDFRVQR